MERILAIPEARSRGAELADIAAALRARHRDFEELLERHFEMVAHHIAGERGRFRRSGAC